MIQGFSNDPVHVKIDPAVGLGEAEIPISGNTSSIAYGGLLAEVGGTTWWVPMEKVLYLRQAAPVTPEPNEPEPTAPGGGGDAPGPPPAA